MQKKKMYFTLPCDFVRLQTAVSFSAVAQQSNTFLQLLQDETNSSQQLFLLVNDIFIRFPIDPSRTSASHECCKGGGGGGQGGIIDVHTDLMYSYLAC